MRILAVHASVNAHGNDAVGAFIPEARAFARSRKARGDEVIVAPFDNSPVEWGKRRASFLAAVRAQEGLDAIVYFGHGLRRAIPSAGFTLDNMRILVQTIAAASNPRVIVVLYACSTAASNDNPSTPWDESLTGDGGFADVLRDRLSEAGHTGWVDAHTVAGHATRNRYARRFYADGVAAGSGGSWLVAPGSPEWPKWGVALREDREFLYGFPFMTEGEIHAYLAGRS